VPVVAPYSNVPLHAVLPVNVPLTVKVGVPAFVKVKELLATGQLLGQTWDSTLPPFPARTLILRALRTEPPLSSAGLDTA